MSTPSVSPFAARVIARITKQGTPSPQSADSSATADPKRDAMMARLAVATDNRERWELAEAINALPPVGAF